MLLGCLSSATEAYLEERGQHNVATIYLYGTLTHMYGHLSYSLMQLTTYLNRIAVVKVHVKLNIYWKILPIADIPIFSPHKWYSGTIKPHLEVFSEIEDSVLKAHIYFFESRAAKLQVFSQRYFQRLFIEVTSSNYI